MASATSNNSSSSSPSSMASRHMSDNHAIVSPTASASASGGTQSRRPSRQVSSPWTQIVRGGESGTIGDAPIEPIASVSVAPPAGDEKKSEESGGGQGNAVMKPVWKRPSNGASSEVGPVMGASSWPALSETTKAPSNKSSSDSLKSLGDVPSSSSVSVSQGIANASVIVPKQVGRPNPNPTPNNMRQRSLKRNGPSGSANGTVSQPSTQGSFATLPLHNPSPRGQNQKNAFTSQSHGGNDSFRNRNDNHHQSHGGRRNQEQHGTQNWNYHKNFNGRDRNPQSQRGSPALVRHAPPPVQQIPPQFYPAQPMQHFGSPVPFPPEMASPYFPHGPFIAPLAHGPFFYQVQEHPPLNVKLQNQIHYYFSEENLIVDTHLRKFMDDQGFVPLLVIAGFKKVTELNVTMQQIVDALQGSPLVEVQGERIRKRDNWQKWLLPKAMRYAFSSPQTVERVDAMTSRVGNLSLNQSSAVGSSSQLQPAEALRDGQHQSSGVVDPVHNHNGSAGASR